MRMVRGGATAPDVQAARVARYVKVLRKDAWEIEVHGHAPLRLDRLNRWLPPRGGKGNGHRQDLVDDGNRSGR